MTEDEPLLTPHELAARWRLSAQTIYRMCNQGDIPYIEIPHRGRGHRVVRRIRQSWVENVESARLGAQ